MSIFNKAKLALAKLRYYKMRVGHASRWAENQRNRFYLDCWNRAAQALNAKVETASNSVLVITKDGARATVCRNYTDLDGPATLRAVGDKEFVQSVLKRHDIPIALSLSFAFEEIASAKRFLEQHQPCVVKPLSGTGGGAGVTTGVCSFQQLDRAIRLAAGFNRHLLIEKQVSGRNIRLLFLDGILLDAVERRPPSVTGDGKASLSKLIKEENLARMERGFVRAQELLQRDCDMNTTIKRQALNWNSVPAADVTIPVKTVINQNATSENVSVVDELCEEIVDTARKAAQCLNVRLAGVDVITENVTVDMLASGGVVLEVNTTPGFYCHQHTDDPSVVLPILKACIAQAQRVANQSTQN
ncbi:hypothetical protein OAE63_01595 [bacterium]|nr:hypothetical protein [bacterium]